MVLIQHRSSSKGINSLNGFENEAKGKTSVSCIDCIKIGELDPSIPSSAGIDGRNWRCGSR